VTKFLTTVGSALFHPIQQADSEKQKVFHQWKAMTTSLLSTLGPHNGRDDKTTEIVEELEDLLEPFRSKLPRDSVHQSLQNLVRNAVTLDESFCGQQEWYILKYPESRFGIHFDRNKMNAREGSTALRQVAFVIRPCLCRAGGRGESYHDLIILDRYVVWAY
jgi:hypothetical protein